MGFFSGASDALEQEMVAQELQRRRAAADALAARREFSLEQDRVANRAVQRENAATMRQQREESVAKAKQDQASKILEIAGPGGVVDPTGAAEVRGAGLGGGLKHEDSVLPSTAMSGIATATSAGPAVAALKSIANEGHAERDLSLGTAAQRETQRKASEPKYINVAGVGLVKTGPDGEPKVSVPVVKPVTWHSVPGVGLVSVAPDGTPKVIVAAKDKPQKPGQPQIFVDPVTKTTHMIQAMPDGTSREIPMPNGLGGVMKTLPKPAPKTPEQIQAEAKARAAGTAEGKQSAAGGSSLLGMIGGLLGPKAPATAPGATTGAPKVGDTKTFPNGTIGVYDGTGWVKQ